MNKANLLKLYISKVIIEFILNQLVKPSGQNFNYRNRAIMPVKYENNNLVMGYSQ